MGGGIEGEGSVDGRVEGARRVAIVGLGACFDFRWADWVLDGGFTRRYEW